MTTLQQINAAASPEVQSNENFETISAAGIFGKRQPASAGLVWGYYGGRFSGATIADGTVTLTGSAVNYVVVALATGVVSASTSSTNWSDSANYARLYEVTAGASTVTSVIDARFDTGGLFRIGGGGGGGGGGTPAGSTRQVQYNNAGAFGAEAGFEYDPATNVLSAQVGKFGDGTAYNSNSVTGDDPHWFEITNNPSSGAGKQLLRINSYGAAGYGGNFHFCRYRGTEASPTAVQSGDFFQSFGYRGWDGSGSLSQSAAAFQIIATENWTSGAHGIKFRFEVTPNGSTTRGLGMELASTGLTVTNDIEATGKIKNLESLIIAASDETTALTASTSKVTFRMPYAFTLSAIRASLTVAQTSGSIFTVDVNEGGTTILSTKITVDNTERTSTTAATPPVISDVNLADDAEITIDVDQIGDGTAKGLKVYLIGKKA